VIRRHSDVAAAEAEIQASEDRRCDECTRYSPEYPPALRSPLRSAVSVPVDSSILILTVRQDHL